MFPLADTASLPIASLTAETVKNSTLSVNGEVALRWPYAAHAQETAILLVDRDARLRNQGGQVRIHFKGPAARLIGTSKIQIGDTVCLSLEGASWQVDVSMISTPGRSVDGELLYRQKLSLTHQNGSSSPATLSINEPAAPLAVDGVPATPAPTRSLSLHPSNIYTTPVSSWSANTPSRVPSSQTRALLPVDVNELQEVDPGRPGTAKRFRYDRNSGGHWRAVDRMDAASSRASSERNSTPGPTDGTPAYIPPSHGEQYPLDMGPPLLPSLQTDLVSGEGDAYNLPRTPQPLQRPVSPRLRPLASPGLPLISPFPATPTSERIQTHYFADKLSSDTVRPPVEIDHRIGLSTAVVHDQPTQASTIQSDSMQSSNNRVVFDSDVYKDLSEPQIDASSVQGATSKSQNQTENRIDLARASYGGAHAAANSIVTSNQVGEETSSRLDSDAALYSSALELLGPLDGKTVPLAVHPSFAKVERAGTTDLLAESRTSGSTLQTLSGILSDAGSASARLAYGRESGGDSLMVESHLNGDDSHRENQDIGDTNVLATAKRKKTAIRQPPSPADEEHRPVVRSSASDFRHRVDQILDLPMPESVSTHALPSSLTDLTGPTSLTTMPHTPRRQSEVPQGLRDWFQLSSSKGRKLGKSASTPLDQNSQLDVSPMIEESMSSTPIPFAKGSHRPTSIRRDLLPGSDTPGTPMNGKGSGGALSEPSVLSGSSSLSKEISQGLRTSLSYYHALASLPQLLNPPSENPNPVVDILAIVSSFTTRPERAKNGPRDFFTLLHILDASSTPVQVQCFRPRHRALPQADVGDVILLRSFLVRSAKHQVHLQSSDSSAWCVWHISQLRRDLQIESDPVESSTSASNPVLTEEQLNNVQETRGPPVEFGSEELQRAIMLRRWWDAMHQSSFLADLESRI